MLSASPETTVIPSDTRENLSERSPPPLSTSSPSNFQHIWPFSLRLQQNALEPNSVASSIFSNTLKEHCQRTGQLGTVLNRKIKLIQHLYEPNYQLVHVPVGFFFSILTRMLASVVLRTEGLRANVNHCLHPNQEIILSFAF